MLSSFRFVILVSVIFVGDVLYETVLSLVAIRDFFFEHVRWVISEKRRAMRRGRQR